MIFQPEHLEEEEELRNVGENLNCVYERSQLNINLEAPLINSGVNSKLSHISLLTPEIQYISVTKTLQHAAAGSPVF